MWLQGGEQDKLEPTSPVATHVSLCPVFVGNPPEHKTSIRRPSMNQAQAWKKMTEFGSIFWT